MHAGELLALRLDRATPTRARLRLRPALPREWARTPVEARVYQDDSGRGALLVRTGFDEHFQVDSLAAGAYRVEVEAPGLGWIAPGAVIVDGRGLWDLGTFGLPLPGRVQLQVPEGTASPLAGQHAWYRRTAALDVREFPDQADGGTVTLPAGEHLLLWRTEGEVRAAGCRVESGRTTFVATGRCC